MAESDAIQTPAVHEIARLSKGSLLLSLETNSHHVKWCGKKRGEDCSRRRGDHLLAGGDILSGHGNCLPTGEEDDAITYLVTNSTESIDGFRHI